MSNVQTNNPSSISRDPSGVKTVKSGGKNAGVKAEGKRGVAGKSAGTGITAINQKMEGKAVQVDGGAALTAAMAQGGLSIAGNEAALAMLEANLVANGQMEGLEEVSKQVATVFQQPAQAEGKMEQIKGKWKDLLLTLNDDTVDINALILSVLRKSYRSVTDDLRFHAEKVEFFNKVKEFMRNELTEARKLIREAENAGIKDEGNLPRPFQPKDIEKEFYGKDDQNGQGGGQGGQGGGQGQGEDPEPITTLGDLKEHVEELEKNLTTAGEDHQMANFELQQILQKQQQLVQLMSNVSKMLHDMAVSVIRNING